jgi:hypothetical protein
VVLTGVWANHLYAVEEVGGRGFVTMYQGRRSMQPQMLPEGGNMNVTVTNIFEPGGQIENDKGKLKVTKANFKNRPAKPLEAFTFLVTADGKPTDLSAKGVKIRKTGGSGTFRAIDLRHGKFTLTYDTEITIEGLPLKTYSVTELAAGFDKVVEVTGNSVVFTNEEIRGETPPSPPGDRPEKPERPRENGGTPEESVTVEVPLVPLESAQPDSPAQKENPRTGDSNDKQNRILFTIFMFSCFSCLVFFRLRRWPQR